ncbi:DUF6879 family protein [Pilimelia anulata]|nr:DUF6879 family protein [Pilimelia anulata]
MEYMSSLRAAGKDVKRIKVVDEPLNDYWRFTHEQTGRSNEAGDTTRWTNRRNLADCLLPPTDFNILDEAELMLLHFDGALNPAGYSLVSEPRVVEAVTKAFRRARDVAVPHDVYRPAS